MRRSLSDYAVGMPGEPARPSIYARAVGMGSVGRPLALGETGPQVSIPGIPNAVSAPSPDSSTYRKIRIPTQAAGTWATLKAMGDLAVEGSQDAHFVAFVRGIIRDCGARDAKCIMSTIFDFVRENCPYRNDPTFMEFVQSPGWTLFVDGQADCDDQSTLIAAMALTTGAFSGVAFRATYLETADEASHVYSMVRPPNGDWTAMDTVGFDSPGQEPPQALWKRKPLDFVVVG